jgi:hypothetical protein
MNKIVHNKNMNKIVHNRSKGNNKGITELRTIFLRESQNSLVYKQTKSVNNRKTVKTVMTLTSKEFCYWHAFVITLTPIMDNFIHILIMDNFIHILIIDNFIHIPIMDNLIHIPIMDNCIHIPIITYFGV